MPARNENFPWLSHYGHYNFFEQRMSEHRVVDEITEVSTGLYSLKLVSGLQLVVFICECYSFDVAEYMETVQELGPVNAVIINSNWCGYSLEAKRHCMSEKVGVYDISGFMAALNVSNFWQ